MADKQNDLSKQQDSKTTPAERQYVRKILTEWQINTTTKWPNKGKSLANLQNSRMPEDSSKKSEWQNSGTAQEKWQNNKTIRAERQNRTTIPVEWQTVPVKKSKMAEQRNLSCKIAEQQKIFSRKTE